MSELFNRILDSIHNEMVDEMLRSQFYLEPLPTPLTLGYDFPIVAPPNVLYNINLDVGMSDTEWGEEMRWRHDLAEREYRRQKERRRVRGRYRRR